MKSTQEWLRELSEASENLVEAFQREKALREAAETQLNASEHAQHESGTLNAKIAELETALAASQKEAENLRNEMKSHPFTRETSGPEAPTELHSEQASQIGTSHTSPQFIPDSGTIEITPEFIDGLVEEIDACLMKLKH